MPNFSVLDGWWDEGYNGGNGWAIGERRAYLDGDTRDGADALALYELIERAIVPLYYQRDEEGLPRQWVGVMKESIRSVAPEFSMSRMVKQYYTDFYQPSMRYGERVDANHYALARELAVWSRRVRAAWGETRIEAEGPSGERLAEGEPAQVRARVWLGSLTPEDTRVELVTARDENGNLRDQRVVVMERAPGAARRRRHHVYRAHGPAAHRRRGLRRATGPQPPRPLLAVRARAGALGVRRVTTRAATWWKPRAARRLAG